MKAAFLSMRAWPRGALLAAALAVLAAGWMIPEGAPRGALAIQAACFLLGFGGGLVGLCLAIRRRP